MAVYRSGKDTVQFPLNEPIPYDLIARIVGDTGREKTERRALDRRPALGVSNDPLCVQSTCPLISPTGKFCVWMFT